jgi:hypothetical protein
MPRDAPEAVAGREAAPDCSAAIMLAEYSEAYPPLSFGTKRHLAKPHPTPLITAQGSNGSEPGMNVGQPTACVLIRWTVLIPTWCNVAVFRTLTPASSERRTAAATPCLTGGRPRRFPCARARASPARVLSRIIAASNSAKTPNIWKRARPDGVEVSSAC